MTVTIVMARTDDGFVSASNANYTTASNAAGDTKSTGNLSVFGQKLSGGVYTIYQAAIGFNVPVTPATDLVTTAQIQLVHSGQNSPSVARTLQLRGYDWTTGGLVAGDYRTRAQAQAALAYGEIDWANNIGAKATYTGHDRLVDALQGGVGTTLIAVLAMSSRAVTGTAPTGDETGTFWSGNSAGTTNDPRLIYTSVHLHNHARTLGACVQLSDGALAYLERDLIDPTKILLHQRNAALATWSSIVPTGVNSTQFSGTVDGAQGFALAVDDSDNVYVVGRNGANGYAISVQSYPRNPAGGWSAPSAVVTSATAIYLDGRLNNFAAAWHSTGNTLMVLASHASGFASSGASGADVAYALFDATAVRNSTATGSRITSHAISMFPPGTIYSTDFNAFFNETGTGLDLIGDPALPNQGHAISFNKGTRLGQNDKHGVMRYQLTSAGTGFQYNSDGESSWGVKDANAKMRVINIGSGRIATVTADSEPGWGITVTMLQNQSTTLGFTTLGQVRMASEGITGFPAPSATATSQAWDALYNAADNKLRIYYVDSATTGRIMETTIDLSTYQATGVTRQIIDHSATATTVYSIRTPRNAWSTGHSWLQVSRQHPVNGLTSTDHLLTFNQAPSAPTLVPRNNFDATTAALFEWTFNDPNPGDTQSAYQLQVEDVSDGSLDLDTGKTASATNSRTVTGGTLVNGKSYRWRVKTWDAEDAEGSWSDYGTFSTSAGGTVTITDPATDNTGGVVTDDYLVKWLVAGTVQASYRVILTRNDTSATVSDSGWVAGTDTQLLVGGMTSDVEHTVSVQVRNSGLVPSGVGTRLITPSYATPEQPVISVTPVPESGYVLISVENPLPGAPATGGPEWTFEEAVMPGTWHPVSATWAVSAEQAHQGAQSGKLTVTGTPVNASVRADSLVTVPGERYTCRFWVYRPVAGSVAATIDWRTAAEAPLSTSQNVVAVAATTWTLVTVTAEAPATAERARYGPTLTGSPATGTIAYLDELAFVEASDRPDVVRNLILRRRVDNGDAWEVLGECPPDGSFRDYTAPAWRELEYMARGESA